MEFFFTIFSRKDTRKMSDECDHQFQLLQENSAPFIFIIGLFIRDNKYQNWLYTNLCTPYTNMSGMSYAARGFGVANRRNRTTPRQQPKGQKWVEVSQKGSTTSAVTLLSGPAPPDREKVERDFTTYSRLSSGHS